MTLEQINQKAIEYARLKHKDEYNDPAFGRDIAESEIDFARGYVAALAEQRAKMPSEEEILQYFNNHFNCYTDVIIGLYETTEIAMTNIAVLKMFEWFRNRIKGGEKNESK